MSQIENANLEKDMSKSKSTKLCAETAKRKERIMHRITRHEEKLKALNGKDLSVHGYWSKGYEEGILEILYELLDDIESDEFDKETKMNLRIELTIYGGNFHEN